mmetsp:Transcript_23953/g.57796  ORF Transcript_23953/g.57796 Transcript_23953/m.57796 type:complete len:138 (+) Transcript_23953:206-619(+)
MIQKMESSVLIRRPMYSPALILKVVHPKDATLTEIVQMQESMIPASTVAIVVPGTRGAATINYAACSLIILFARKCGSGRGMYVKQWIFYVLTKRQDKGANWWGGLLTCWIAVPDDEPPTLLEVCVTNKYSSRLSPH